MADTRGMSENPGEVYSIQSRLVCAKCWVEPAVVNAQNHSGMLTVTVKCHGETQTKAFDRKDLVFTQKFFE